MNFYGKNNSFRSNFREILCFFLLIYILKPFLWLFSSSLCFGWTGTRNVFCREKIRCSSQEKFIINEEKQLFVDKIAKNKRHFLCNKIHCSSNAQREKKVVVKICVIHIKARGYVHNENRVHSRHIENHFRRRFLYASKNEIWYVWDRLCRIPYAVFSRFIFCVQVFLLNNDTWLRIYRTTIVSKFFLL